MIDVVHRAGAGSVPGGRYTVIALGLLAGGLLAWQPLVTWAELRAQSGAMYDVPMLLASMGPPLLCALGTLVGASSHTLRPTAAGAVIGVGLLVAWATAWRLGLPMLGGESAWVTGLGAVLAIGMGVALLALRDGPRRDARVTSAE